MEPGTRSASGAGVVRRGDGHVTGDTQGQGTPGTEPLWEEDYEVRAGDRVCSLCECAERRLVYAADGRAGVEGVHLFGD